MAKRIIIFGWAESVHIRRWVTGLRQRGYILKLVSLGGNPVEDLETTVFQRSGRLAYIRFARAAVREAREFDPDLIHVHYAAGFGIWGLLARFNPTVVSVWGTEILDLAERPLYRNLIRSVLKRATAITATSEYLRDATYNLYPPTEDKMTVIPFGVEIPAEQPAFPSDKPVKICYLKKHDAIYGPDILIRALAKVRRRLPEIRLTMAGSGKLTKQLQTLVADCGLRENVEFSGFIENQRVGSFLSEHHFMVMPSLRESFGVAALEAAAYGRPTVATTVGGIPEVVRHEKTGLLVPPGDVEVLADAILALALDPDRCRQMGLAGRAFVEERYDWQLSLDKMAELYDRLITEVH